MKRKEIKWRHKFRGTMTGRQDGIIFRIYRKWDAPEQGYTVSCHDTKKTGRTINTAGHMTFTWEEAEELEKAGISYRTLLHLTALQQEMDGLAHNILLGFERGEGWPDGT